ncbi:MAG: ATPase [Alphaproteobacteria bacterium HGW-Alphaproteobacteria-12]|nr:MAG: ATPase [Alphaproteobacteria bacterium HGW-Alphaproteobacteria-12]
MTISATITPAASGNPEEAEPEAPPFIERRGLPAAAPKRIAHIVSVSGSQAIAVLEREALAQGEETRVEIGQLVKVTTPASSVVGLISAVSAPAPASGRGDEDLRLVEINLAGEVVIDPRDDRLAFRRGVTHLPALGDAVLLADRHDLTRVYTQPNVATIEVGSLYQDAAVPARFLVDDLLAKHFIVVGTTGCGKSCALTTILQRVLDAHGHAHIVMLDVHNEYPTAFGERAELINPNNLHLPFWLLNFQELSAALTSGDAYHEAETEILGDAVLAAKRRYSDASANRQLARRPGDAGGMTVDAPTPFRLSDVLSFIDEQLGKLERTQKTLPYRRLKNRIETLASDQRYSFMFGSLTVQDTMTDILARLFRVPNEGRPITVIDLSTVPPEILDVVISVISRLAFDLAVWSKGGLPMLLVCEEAHRYAPAAGDGFEPTRQALSRIAKEGRKYGLSLALVTQRPSELDTTILSQCSTVVAMRLSTERDQQVMRSNTHDSALDLLDFLPLLGDREAIVLGQGVAMPMRIRFSEVAEQGVPRNLNSAFSLSWSRPNLDRAGLEAIVSRWRHAGRERG